jgi:lipoate-protein ligase A
MLSKPDNRTPAVEVVCPTSDAAPHAEKWLWLDTGPGAADFNMALDEALLESAVTRTRPIVRHYGWTERAATFGYSQRYREIESLTTLRPLIRRPTGGGLVPHDVDWTYSLAFPPDHWWTRLRASESYERVHAWIRAAFARVGVVTSLSPCSQKDAPGQCFVGAERHDLLWRGRKIAGAAQRRNRLGLLVQGSIRSPSAGLRRESWEQAMRESGTQRWGIAWEPFECDAALHRRATRLAQAKYSRTEFNQSR